MVTFIVKAITENGVQDVEVFVDRNSADNRADELDRQQPNAYHVVESVEMSA